MQDRQSLGSMELAKVQDINRTMVMFPSVSCKIHQTTNPRHMVIIITAVLVIIPIDIFVFRGHGQINYAALPSYLALPHVNYFMSIHWKCNSSHLVLFAH